MFKQIMERNLLKYSAGNSITCKHCGKIADWRDWVMAESPTGANMWQSCKDCFAVVREEATEKGWNITTTETKPTRKAKLPLTLETRNIKTGEMLSVPACKAFTEYGETFLAHKNLVNDKYWVVSHVGTGAAACPQTRFKTKISVITWAHEKVLSVGQEKFAEALARARFNSQ